MATITVNMEAIVAEANKVLRTMNRYDLASAVKADKAAYNQAAETVAGYAERLKMMAVAFADMGFQTADSVAQHFRNMSIGTPVMDSTGAMYVEIRFTDDLSRPSLYAGASPLENIIVYMAAGRVHPKSANVYGMWKGHVVHGAIYHKPVNPLQDAVDAFNTVYGGSGVYASILT